MNTLEILENRLKNTTSFEEQQKIKKLIYEYNYNYVTKKISYYKSVSYYPPKNNNIIYSNNNSYSYYDNINNGTINIANSYILPSGSNM